MTFSNEQAINVSEPTVEVVKQSHSEAIVQVQNSLASTRERVKQEIIANGEAQKISDQLDATNPQSIVEFGKPMAEQMSKVADEVLKRTSSNNLTETGKMMEALSKIMKTVDIDEIAEKESKGLFDKIFNNAQKKLEQFMNKYNSIGNQIDKICVELRTYENQIKTSNIDLENLYKNGIESYKALMKYNIAGEMALVELDNYINSRNSLQDDPTVQLELNNLMQAKQLLEQRVHDLQIAENVALQSLPMLKAIQFGNLNLARKINSAFIITLPVFKNAIAQAVLIKQQQLQAKSLEALDKTTNEMLLKNSQNVANNMRQTAMLSGKSSIDIDTLENSWKNIMDGINDTKSIQAELSKQREQDKQRLEQINNQYLTQIQGI